MTVHASAEEIVRKVREDFIESDILFSLYDDYESMQTMASCQYTWEIAMKNSELRESVTKEEYQEAIEDLLESKQITLEDLKQWGDDLMFPYKG